jgi:hypothetical protein
MQYSHSYSHNCGTACATMGQEICLRQAAVSLASTAKRTRGRDARAAGSIRFRQHFQRRLTQLPPLTCAIMPREFDWVALAQFVL